MATPSVYKRFDDLRAGVLTSVSMDWNTEPNFHHWSTLSAIDLLPLLINDLEPPAFSLSPPLVDLHHRASQTLGRIVRMSGSGSTLFSLYDDPDSAHHAAHRIQSSLNVRAIAVDLCPALPDPTP
jgi:4-diphosphocytidyl-2C-methyl-D-erythritol kinase